MVDVSTQGIILNSAEGTELFGWTGRVKGADPSCIDNQLLLVNEAIIYLNMFLIIHSVQNV